MTLGSGSTPIELYSIGNVVPLCDDLRVDHEFAADLTSQLNSAANTWLSMNADPLTAQSDGDTRKELLRIARALLKAKAELASISDTAWTVMHEASNILNSDHHTSGIENVAGPEWHIDEELRRSVRIIDNIETSSVSMNNLTESLSILTELADVGAEAVLQPSSGPNVDRALARWVYTMRQLVERTLHVPFTRDVALGNEPISPAACFCVNAFAIISPETPRSRVLNALKYEITEHNKSIADGVRIISF